jgi:hypothetical protein
LTKKGRSQALCCHWHVTWHLTHSSMQALTEGDTHTVPLLMFLHPPTHPQQVRRHLHTYSPSQLVSVLAAVAAYPPGEGQPASSSGWHPGRLLLYDFITHSSRPEVMGAWSGRQAAQILWAFSRFRWASLHSSLDTHAYMCAHMHAFLHACRRFSIQSHTQVHPIRCIHDRYNYQATAIALIPPCTSC